MRNISNRALISHQILRARITQVLVQHAVQPPSFVLVSIDAVLDLLRRISREVVRLAWVQVSKPPINRKRDV